MTLDELVMYFKRPILVDENGCWNWMGSISTQGYALWNHKKVYDIIHEMDIGPRTPGSVMRHSCHNKRCINPEHTIEGTYSENIIDDVLNGRRGLGKETYKKMYDLYQGGMRQADIARELGVSTSLVSQFLKGGLMCTRPEHFEHEGESDAELG